MADKKLRLVMWDVCARDCDGCCNKQIAWAGVPELERRADFFGYDEIMLTGGEPMLDSMSVYLTVEAIREAYIGKSLRQPKVIVYTADVSDVNAVLRVLGVVDGMTITLHTQEDVEPFMRMALVIRDCFAYLSHSAYTGYYNKSLRLNVFKGVTVPYADLADHWLIKDNIEWVENCPLPEGETLMRLGRGLRKDISGEAIKLWQGSNRTFLVSHHWSHDGGEPSVHVYRSRVAPSFAEATYHIGLDFEPSKEEHIDIGEADISYEEEG